MISAINTISAWAVPLLLLGIPILGLARGVKVYESFVEGAKEGFAAAVRIIPFLVAMFVAIQVFQQSGMMSVLTRLISPLTSRLFIPDEVIPLALIRPLSGSGALGMLASILETYGPDSLIGMMASTIMGSMETTFYVSTVYFGAVGVRKVRHALPAAIAADIAGFLTAALVVTLVFAA